LDIDFAFREILRQCQEWNFKAVKIRISFSLLIEYLGSSGYGGFRKAENGHYVKYIVSVDGHSETKTIPFLFQISKIESE
jgi:hypothetical protein